MTSIALVGPGRHGTAIAQLFASHGVDIDLYHHRPAKAELAARTVRESARDAEVRVARSLAEAVSRNELVVLTTLWDAPQRAVLGELGDLMRDRALLDVSNPLDVTPAGIIPRRPLQGSAGQFVATLLPDGAGRTRATRGAGVPGTGWSRGEARGLKRAVTGVSARGRPAPPAALRRQAARSSAASPSG